jgi:hypothetical protein
MEIANGQRRQVRRLDSGFIGRNVVGLLRKTWCEMIADFYKLWKERNHFAGDVDIAIVIPAGMVNGFDCPAVGRGIRKEHTFLRLLEARCIK